MSAPHETQPEVRALAGELAAYGARDCRVAFVLGSGLGAFADGLSERTVIAADSLESLPRSAVPGHAGRIVLGEIGGVRVLVQEGRVHLYEGWSAHEVTRAVRAFAELGVRSLVLTNAGGSLVPEWEAGSYMLVEDHISLTGAAPLLRTESRRGRVYDRELGAVLERAAAAVGIELRTGTYAGVLGPAYETPAEIRMLRWMGAHAVGMSTVAEASAAHAAGLRVAAVSCLTNHAAGISESPLDHADVVRVGRSLADGLVRLFASAAGALANA